MSHNISTKPGFKPCGCHEKRDKDKVDLLTKEYEELIAQLKAAKEAAEREHDYWQSKAESLVGLALEKNATANKNAILEAIAAIEPYVALTDSEMDAIFGITPAVVTIAVIEVGPHFVGDDSVFADRSAADDTVDGTTVMYCFKYQSMKFYVHDENPSIGDNVYAWDDENESYYVYSTILSMVDSEGHEITE